jgi:hypothetical protein
MTSGQEAALPNAAMRSSKPSSGRARGSCRNVIPDGVVEPREDREGYGQVFAGLKIQIVLVHAWRRPIQRELSATVVSIPRRSLDGRTTKGIGICNNDPAKL